MTRFLFTAAMALVLAASVAGCGGRQMGDVRGQVTHDGQPVTSGVVIFSPIAEGDDMQPGKSATGDIQSDGTFRLSTYHRHDGAVLARHRVRYVPPYEEEDVDEDEDEVPDDGNAVDVTAYRHLALPPDFEVEVQSGDNEIRIELTDRARR